MEHNQDQEYIDHCFEIYNQKKNLVIMKIIQSTRKAKPKINQLNLGFMLLDIINENEMVKKLS
jgi:hypothetical protein